MPQLTQLAIQKLNGFVTASAQAYGVKPSDISAGFAVDPVKEQTLVGNIQESAEFLNMISIVPVDNQMGEVGTIEQNEPLASKTDTSVDGVERVPRTVGSSSANEYRCHQVDFDWGIPYSLINQWAHNPNFNMLLAAQIRRRQSLDMIRIGWNGTSDAKTTNKADKSLSDVGIGWPKLIKDNNPSNYLDSEVINVSDAMNLDVIAHEAREGLPIEHRLNPDLILIAGFSLVSHERGKVYAAQGRTPTEKEKIQTRQVIGTYGGMPTYYVPEFPAKAVMVTTFANLQIIIQMGTSFTMMVNKVEKNQMQHWMNRNMDWAIGDYDLSIYIPDNKIILPAAPSQ